MLKRLTFLSVLAAVLLMWGLPVMAAEPAEDRAENIVPSAGAKVAGDILFHCDVQSIPNDNRILGIETLRDTIFITGGGQDAPNWVHVWTMPGGICTYGYTVQQYTPETWGWRDIACDGEYLYASDDRLLECFYVTPGGVVLVPANNITISGMADITVVRAVAYDEDHDWFWTANFASNIYAFDRTGTQMAGPFANTYDVYGMAYDNDSPGGPFLWVHTQDSCNVRQFDPNTGVYTGVVYSGWGDGDPGVSGIAGGLCVMEGDPSKGKGSVTLLGIMQGTPFDEMYGMEIHVDEEEWPNHKMHFPQLPDEIGWDVFSTAPIICADDWQCSQTGPVEDIHFWGSWKNLDGMPGTDDYPPGGEMPHFAVFILRNLPVGHPQNPYPYSIPGDTLWEWWGEIQGTPYDPPTLESWYDPVIDSTVCNDHIPYWRYDFFVEQAYPPIEPFIQYQDSIYWLAVAPTNIDPPYQWGWKNSRDHFMDDAVWSDDPYTGPWFEMYEPPRCNWFDVLFDGTGTPEDWGSTNYYGQGWYFYPEFGWWNMWFYDNPFTYDHPKEVFLDFYIELAGPMPYAEFAINWSTDIWSMEGELGRPPLPGDVAGMPEDIYIGREEFPVFPGWNHIEWFWHYNPEWISIDFRAIDVIINGFIYHECVQTSMDLAFVITGEPPPVICGDVNNNGVVDVGDVVYLVTYLYKSGPAPDPMVCVGDVNNNDIVDVGDLVYLVSYLYKGGPAPDPLCCNPEWKHSQSNSTPHGEHRWVK